MAILRTITDALVVRATRNNAYESRYLRDHFERRYGIRIGLYSNGYFDRWRIPPGTVVGRYSTIAKTARIIGANHPVSSLSTHPYFYLKEFDFIDEDLHEPRTPVIEDDVWMGHYAVVTPGCKVVGRGSIIGAGSVVARDVPRYAIMMGSPAQLVRYRFSQDVIDAIEATEWWLLDKEELRRGLRFAENFLAAPSVESARAFMRAIGRSDSVIASPPHVRASKQQDTIKPAGLVSGSAPNAAVLDLLKNEVPGYSPDKLDSSFAELGLDSLGFALLRASCEQLSGRSISDQDWGLLSTPADVIAFLSPPTADPSTQEHAAVPGPPLMATASAANLYWLPKSEDWAQRISALEGAEGSDALWGQLVALANCNLDVAQTGRLDRLFLKHFAKGPDHNPAFRPIRLAVLGSSTLTHLLPAIRIGGLRRGLHITLYEGAYGQYFQELADKQSGFHAFRPDVALLALDAAHLARGIDAGADEAAADAALREALSHLKQCWRMAREQKIALVQQTALPTFRPLLGNNEQRLPGSKSNFIARLNAQLRELPEVEGLDLLAIDSSAAACGLEAWHDPVYWHRAKQEVKPSAAPLYGDMLARLLGARQGRTFKCMVLDLDNTIWGGVIGDDGLDGIVLGQGSATGEAHLELQRYALEQAKRGIILAVCSKNDENNAREPFERHPEMVLKLQDIACFVANWEDKVKNIRRISQELNIGLDALVFIDDNPFERSLVRSELPMVAVPEMPQEPALYARTLSDAGYFEAVAVTTEDRERARQYQANSKRAAMEAEAADMPTYLRSLDMELVWSEFDAVGLHRIVQLINKTNQFNLTTRRYSEDEVHEVMKSVDSFGLQFRLRDRFGDSGIICIVVGKPRSNSILLETWLMSCRVLGRQVEEAVLNVVAHVSKAHGFKALVGEYHPTAKNEMVRMHYAKLGFAEDRGSDTHTSWVLDLGDFIPRATFIRTTPDISGATGGARDTAVAAGDAELGAPAT